jgi:hypothetical protein
MMMMMGCGIEHVSGSMSSVRGTLSSYQLYYYRLSELFRHVSTLAIPDKTGAGMIDAHVTIPIAIATDCAVCSFSYNAIVIVPVAAKKKEAERVRHTIAIALSHHHNHPCAC